MNGIEIKYDQRFTETGNLFIETAERSSPTRQWHEAGINRRGNSWGFAIGDYQTVYVFAVKHLRALSRLERYKRVSTPTAEGFLLPIEHAERWCVFTLPGAPS